MKNQIFSVLICLALCAVVNAAEPGEGLTKGIIDFKTPKSVHYIVGDKGHTLKPEVEKFKNRWEFKDGILTASPQWDSLITKDVYKDFRLHVEFNVNNRPGVAPEKNGNSGIYIQQRYEVQILNSYGVAKKDYLKTYCGSLYKQKLPDQLVCKPAGEWQTYDIVFRSARFKDGKRIEKARITVYQNGKLIHDDYGLTRQTGAGKKEGPEPGPIKLQGHQNQVKFRNIWIQKLNLETKKKKTAQKKTKKKSGYKYVIPFEDIPPAPALRPKEALKTIKLHEDFEISLAVSDPAVQSPVSMRFDGDGRLWTVEMVAYMNNPDGKGEEEPISRISIHEDTNGDGYFDKSKPFMDDLVLPRAITFYKNGLLYAGHEKLYFIEIINDKPGKKIVIDENYAQKGNVEHRSNGLMRGLDNWIYNVKSDNRYREIDGKWVKEKTDFRGQWGMSKNNYGRIYYNENWFGIRANQLMPNLMRRNKNYQLGGRDTINLSFRDRLYPARITPGVNRGGEGAIDDKGYLEMVTAACGPVRYRGDQFPQKYQDAAFFCEPSAHLIRMIHVSDNDGQLKGEHRLKNREFLASMDERFRPVNLFNGPDGALYIVDLYHGILQHKGYLTRYLREHIDHRNLHTHPRWGRIYRVIHKGSPKKTFTKMEAKKAIDWVPLLAHANGWWRDKAQQKIIDSGDANVIEAVTSVALDVSKPLGQIHALWTLEGLDQVNKKAIQGALKSNDPYVIESALRVSELLKGDDAKSILAQCESLLGRSELVIQRQLAASLSKIPGEKSLQLLKKVVLKHMNAKWLREVAINGLEGREAEFKAVLGDDLKDNQFKKYLEHCLTPKTTAGRFKAPRDKKHLASYKRGEKFYIGQCMACHGVDGKGMEKLGPPLIQSEWVNQSQKRLSAILLQGLMGPITVNGKKYVPAAAMPGLKHAPGVTDQNLADVATFIRHAWNNRKSSVSADTVNQVRKELKERQTTFTPEELQKAYK